MTKGEKATEPTKTECTRAILPVKDALEVLSGKWKLPIIISLTFGNKRFKEISKDVANITDKVLSKELKDMEANKLVTRTVYDTFPPTVEYAVTEHGKSLYEVIAALNKWGTSHRKKIHGK
jgi:DNA-binding HxlR family transcriptional regulator